MGEMVVVGVTDYNHIDDWQIFDHAGNFGEAFGSHPLGGGTSFFKDGVEEDSKTTREFDIVASMTEPCCAKGVGGSPRGEEVWFSDCDVWRGGVGPF